MALYLILEVQGGPDLEIGDPPRKVFDTAGGRIGRALDCEWVLSNRYVSRHHATISHTDGVFYIESIGANGVAVNDPKVRVPKRTRRALQSGDRLFLDQYEIRAAIADDSKRNAVSVDTHPIRLPSWDPLEPAARDNLLEFPYPDLDKPKPAVKAAKRPAASAANQVKTEGIRPSPAHRAARTAAALDASAAITIPQEWESTGLTNEVPRLEVTADPAPTPQKPAAVALPSTACNAPPSAAGFDTAGFLQGAGLAPAAVPAGQAVILGQMVRTVVQGLIDVLRARAEFRSQLLLPDAPPASPDNPLRLAGKAADALASLLQPAAPGTLAPLEALEDALDELRFHQLAMLAGLHSGFQSVTGCFDPQKLTEQCERGHLGNLARFGVKGRYWDYFVDLFEQVAAYPDGGLRRQYVEAFSAAYERQLEDLKRSRVRTAN